MARLARLLGQRAQCGQAGGIERLGIDAGRGRAGDGNRAARQPARVSDGDERRAHVSRDVRRAVFVIRQRSLGPCHRAVLRLPGCSRRAERSAACLAAKHAQFNTLGVGRMGEREPDDGGFESTHGEDCARRSTAAQRESGFDKRMTEHALKGANTRSHDTPRRTPPQTAKYPAPGWCTTIALVDCSGSIWKFSVSRQPIRSGCSRRHSFSWSAMSGHAG